MLEKNQHKPIDTISDLIYQNKLLEKRVEFYDAIAVHYRKANQKLLRSLWIVFAILAVITFLALTEAYLIQRLLDDCKIMIALYNDVNHELSQCRKAF